MAEYYLAHAGVKGMKWGVRKAQKKAARLERRAQKQADRDARRAAAGRTKTKGKRMAGRIVGGVLGNVAIGTIGTIAGGAATAKGHFVVGQMLQLGTMGAIAGNTVKTVQDTITIGKDRRNRW